MSILLYAHAIEATPFNDKSSCDKTLPFDYKIYTKTSIIATCEYKTKADFFKSFTELRLSRQFLDMLPFKCHRYLITDEFIPQAENFCFEQKIRYLYCPFHQITNYFEQIFGIILPKRIVKAEKDLETKEEDIIKAKEFLEKNDISKEEIKIILKRSIRANMISPLENMSPAYNDLFILKIKKETKIKYLPKAFQSFNLSEILSLTKDQFTEKQKNFSFKNILFLDAYEELKESYYDDKKITYTLCDDTDL